MEPRQIGADCVSIVACAGRGSVFSAQMAMQTGVSSNSSTAMPGQPLSSARRKYKIVLIKPSHYDDDGYVIQWWRSTIPSNSLASVYGAAAGMRATRNALGPDVDIDIEAYDECNTVIPM